MCLCVHDLCACICGCVNRKSSFIILSGVVQILTVTIVGSSVQPYEH